MLDEFVVRAEAMRPSLRYKGGAVSILRSPLSSNPAEFLRRLWARSWETGSYGDSVHLLTLPAAERD